MKLSMSENAHKHLTGEKYAVYDVVFTKVLKREQVGKEKLGGSPQFTRPFRDSVVARNQDDAEQTICFKHKLNTGNGNVDEKTLCFDRILVIEESWNAVGNSNPELARFYGKVKDTAYHKKKASEKGKGKIKPKATLPPAIQGYKPTIVIIG